MKSTRVLGVIPSHLESQRLPRKALIDIAGKPLILWVYEAARRTPLLHEVMVATDSKEIEEICQKAGIEVILTGKHPSGTDRLHEVMSRIEADVYVNIQGDEPLLGPEHFQLLIPPVTQRVAQVSTLKVEMDWVAAQDPNKVKVVTDRQDRALYFSRCPIPFQREKEDPVRYYKHLGIYAYHRTALELFYSLPQSPLELSERLEQLRFLENGVSIQVVETPYDTIGVDTEEDLRQVKAILMADRADR